MGKSSFNKKIIEPEYLTMPTVKEYEEAMKRLHVLTNGDDQAMRDVRTAYWMGWQMGYDTRKGDKT